jgi:hypothetical protein
MTEFQFKTFLTILMDDMKEELEQEGKVKSRMIFNQGPELVSVPQPEMSSDIFARVNKVFCDLMNISHFVLVNEVWTVAGKKGDPLPTVPPREHPDRTEAILIEAKGKEEGPITMIQPFTRENGKIIFGKLIDDSDYSTSKRLSTVFE